MEEQTTAQDEVRARTAGTVSVAGDIPDYLQDLPVQVDVLLGRLKLTVKELLDCGPGSVIDVGKKVSDKFDLYINNILVARGEVVTINDRLGLKIVEVIDKPNLLAGRL